LASIIFKETTTIGVRYNEVSRFKLERQPLKINTKYGAIRAKKTCYNISPEYDDCARIAQAKKKHLGLKVLSLF
ncbi:MAG: LarC family nickel insertion protein, partial [Gammaproteobacteria bacterium]|nr:LarC family nickel insertion protein [Gammaproteobacteria bacterium]